MDDTLSPIGEVLFEHHMAHQTKLKRAVTQKEFADYIGIDDKLYNHIYKGRRKPSMDVVEQLARFFNDLRFYDAVNEPRPDPNLFMVQSNWSKLPNGTKKKIAEMVEKTIDDGK